jgi:hypothetical protein
MTGCCEHGNDLTGSKTADNFLPELRSIGVSWLMTYVHSCKKDTIHYDYFGQSAFKRFDVIQNT